MLMVFYFHSALFVNPLDLYGDNKGSSAGFMIFLAFTHLLIMPFFFLIGGASTRYALNVMTNGQYLHERFKRLIIPYITGALTIVPLHNFLVGLYKSNHKSSFLEYYLHHFRTLSFTMNPGVFAEIGVHLWFLSFLFIFSLLTLPVFLYLRKDHGQSVVSKLAAFCEKPGAFLLFIAPITLIQAALKVIFPGYRNWADFFYWLVFFVYGYIIMSDKRFTQAMAKQGIIALIIGCISFAGISISLLDGHLLPWLFQPRYSAAYLLFLMFSSLHTWCWIVFFLSIGMRFLNFSNGFLKYFNEEILPFYILHLIVISLIGSYLIPWNANKMIYFLGLRVLVWVISYLFEHTGKDFQSQVLLVA